MDFVENDIREIFNSFRIIVDNVSQYFRGDHKHRRGLVYYGVAGYESHAVFSVECGELSVLLVGQRFDRRRVDYRFPFREAFVHYVVCDKSFAVACMRCDDDIVVSVDGLYGLFLKRFECFAFEFHGIPFRGFPPHSGVLHPAGFRVLSPELYRTPFSLSRYFLRAIPERPRI